MMLQVGVDSSGFPDVQTTRGKVSPHLISLSCKTSEQTSKFLHCGAERQQEETICGFSVGGFNLTGVVALNMELQQSEGTAHSTLQLLLSLDGADSAEPD